MEHTRRLNYRTDKSYQQTILTAYRRNFHYLFEFSDILPIFAKQLLELIYLSQSCRWLLNGGGFTFAFLLYLLYIALHHHFWWCGEFFVLIKLIKVKVVNTRKAY